MCSGSEGAFHATEPEHTRVRAQYRGALVRWCHARQASTTPRVPSIRAANYRLAVLRASSPNHPRRVGALISLNWRVWSTEGQATQSDDIRFPWWSSPGFLESVRLTHRGNGSRAKVGRLKRGSGFRARQGSAARAGGSQWIPRTVEQSVNSTTRDRRAADTVTVRTPRRLLEDGSLPGLCDRGWRFVCGLESEDWSVDEVGDAVVVGVCLGGEPAFVVEGGGALFSAEAGFIIRQDVN